MDPIHWSEKVFHSFCYTSINWIRGDLQNEEKKKGNAMKESECENGEWKQIGHKTAIWPKSFQLHNWLDRI